MYLIGRVLLTFFVIADIQVIYIMEMAPADKRGTLCSLTKFISFLGVLIIPLSRDLLLDPSGRNWRDVCLVPTVVAIVCLFLIALFIRESDVFLDSRIAWLERPYEERVREREERKKSRQVDTNRGGLGTAIRYILKDKQLRSIVLAQALFLLGTNAFVAYYNTVCMKNGMSMEEITFSMHIYPVVAAVATLFSGMISDRIGRKKVCAVYAVLSLCGLIGYIATAGSAAPALTGAFYGLCYGCY